VSPHFFKNPAKCGKIGHILKKSVQLFDFGHFFNTFDRCPPAPQKDFYNQTLGWEPLPWRAAFHPGV
jgi:hypothetical protein